MCFRRRAVLVAAGCGALTALVAMVSLSPEPGWPDSDGYAAAVDGGRWVAHPPGYPLFVLLARGAGLAVPCGYGACVLVSFLLAVASSVVTAVVCMRVGGLRAGAWLGGAYAVAWLPVMLATAGTPHSGDLLLSALLLALVWSPPRRNGTLVLAGLCGLLVAMTFFRFSTLVMLAPAVAALWASHRRDGRWWLVPVVGLLLLVGFPLLVPWLSGAPDEFRAMAAGIHATGRTTSILFAGPRPEAFMNILRAGLWFAIAIAFVPLLFLRGAGPWRSWPVAATVLAALGPLAACALYHIPHPGYLAPAIPPVFVLAARASREGAAARSLPCAAAISAVLWLGVWFSPLFEPHPATKPRAALNAFLGQYTRAARQQSTWKSLSLWLVEAGYAESVPAQRRDDLRQPRRFK